MSFVKLQYLNFNIYITHIFYITLYTKVLYFTIIFLIVIAFLWFYQYAYLVRLTIFIYIM